MEKELDFQIGFFENLIREYPDFTDVLEPLAAAYTEKGMYQKGLELDLKLARFKPREPIVFYNLACSYSLLREEGKALEALEKALALGYRDRVWLEKDADLDNIRRSEAFRRLFRKYFPPPADG